ncbi:hypothetical protein [Desulfofustis limnaeus]|uniref:Uncharacterized protein n=1 Tax=Desulfofustis limnaeus TaxID=2740163 RepID=A0ABM7WCR8_9BACT|nr:hypothetical protein [Desulfofustis limnaeus]BDD88733.1 hypothetical protein DPPLL_30980 [Desulfofustis limnaeus]
MQEKNQKIVKNILLSLAEYVKVKGINGVADYLGENRTRLYAWIKNNNIPDTGIILAKHPEISVDWLRTGKGPMLKQEQQKSRLRKTHEIYMPGDAEEDERSEHPSSSDMLIMTAKVLESNTVYRSALASNIRAFFQAVQGEEEMNDMREKMDQLMSDMAEMKELMKTMAKLETAEKKEAGNDH